MRLVKASVDKTQAQIPRFKPSVQVPNWEWSANFPALELRGWSMTQQNLMDRWLFAVTISAANLFANLTVVAKQLAPASDLNQTYKAAKLQPVPTAPRNIYSIKILENFWVFSQLVLKQQDFMWVESCSSISVAILRLITPYATLPSKWTATNCHRNRASTIHNSSMMLAVWDLSCIRKAKNRMRS